MKPEEKAEIILWDWLMTKGEFIEDIYFNRKNKLGWKTFQVKGTIKRKPDFIIKINDGFSEKYIVVEVKSSNQSKDILDAKKIIDYYCLYVREETKYYIDNEEIPIAHFVVASDSSPKGYLFKEEKLIDNIKQTESKSKNYVASIGLIPRFEGCRTFEIVRSLWNWFKDIRKEYKNKCGLGILIADIDNGFVPKMMISHYNYNKKRWSQRWWKL